jgi:proline iminopeptidase
MDMPALKTDRPYCELLAGLRAGRLTTPRGRIFFEAEGRGPLLVLQSGGPGGTHQCFHPFFGAAAAFATVLYHDPIGVGASDRLNSGRHDLAGLVGEIEELRLHFGAERIVLLGHSFGGLIAQLYALAHPERLSGLVLVTSSTGLPEVEMAPRRLNERMSAADLDAIRATLKGGASRGGALRGADAAAESEAAAFRAGGWKRHFLARPSEDYMAHRRYEWAPGPGFVAAIEAEARAIDLSGRFEGFDVPTLVMDSPNDLVWQPDKAARLAANHPHAKCLSFGASAHYPFAEEGERFFSELRAFIAKL